MAKDDQEKMSVNEAGHLGGEKTSQTHDHEYYQRIGHEGGEKTSQTHDRAFYEEIGREGGQNSSSSTGKLSPIEVEKSLKGAKYPAEKDELVDKARENDAGDMVMDFLEHMPDQEYESPTEVTKQMKHKDHEDTGNMAA
jgi:general stress protein YciG